ncbi:hypothetical protein Q4519_13680 [Motilimonas sp. 1_MG-2023]|uniref:hypothetical protein n=1 Tax=Motilimonas sp. 1_MG-2023 TaxID=3062672 RepID=UPI0026E1AE95|nr:hypothetical protein [Motilimonas sp. 1_MG-2023]MDO6526737.1 hypothetical protein [Motilimonas sp. 1_MG-2023]
MDFTLRLICILLCTGILSVQASTDPSSSERLTEKVLGDWHCSFAVKESGAQVSIESDDLFIRGGKLVSKGLLKAKFAPDLPEIEYAVNSTSNWKVEQGYLISTLTDVSVVNLTDPEFDNIVNPKELFPVNVSESLQILAISNSTMVLKSSAAGQEYRCKRNN